LAVETSADLCSYALMDDKGIVEARLFRHRMHLSERIIIDIDTMLRDVGCALKDLSAIAVDIGPGSFMGIRIGLMTAKTWADALSAPLVGVSALEVVAFPYAEYPNALVLSLLYARPGYLHTQLFKAIGGELHPLSEPMMRTEAEIASDFHERMRNEMVILCGEGVKKTTPEFIPGLKEENDNVVICNPLAPVASSLAWIARKRLEIGGNHDPMALTPLYLAPPQITISSKNKNALT